jgi:glyoxylase-like metal-dependent hydrolase (beta-lactamase superfamily II)
VRDGLDWWRTRDPDAPFNVGTRLLAALGGWGVLDELADGEEAAAGVRLMSAPGHRPGHACVAIDGLHLHLADVIHHREHVAHPGWDPVFDADPPTAFETRLAWFGEAAATGSTVTHAHVAGSGRIERTRTGFRWQEV